ncbi:anti-sigma factor antagonist [Treponema medium]|uniref:Anti-sigma factor antagonist n=3 Tax=Treponema medium TaxID=58231 RepID=A0AA87NPH5_TREMD|nr:STAS domain-containing protein [Treponema medium]EPF28013.1 anti-anti-sigma factor [Treponema medium ATCC 700293]QSH97807.1 anti-sigma factor antagonist [Treponema medium]
MDNLTITEKTNDAFVLLTVAGSINSYTYHEFETKVYNLIKEHSIVLDVSRVTNLSSSGLGILMAASEDGEELGHKIYILNPSEVVKLAIASTGFSEVFPIIRSLDEVK